MTFLNPGALIGLLAIGIPIVIHLLNKFQIKEVKWAAMRFLRESVEKNQRRLQMEDVLLLLLRCLLIALLILVLARPAYLSGVKTTGAHQVAAVIIIDNSYSMGLTNGIQTCLERAQTSAAQILAAFPTGSSSAIFYAADGVKPVIAQPTYDFNLLREKIREAKLTDRATDLSNALQLAVTTLQKHEGPESKEIYLITDGQANGWPSLDQLEKQLRDIQPEITVHIVLVGDSAESNLGVTNLRLESGLTPVNQPLRCSIEVLNGSQSDARDVRISLLVDDQPAVDETIIDTIPAGTSRSVSLFAKLRTEGFHTISARIPHDRLPADDQRTMAVRAIREVKVLLIDGTAATTPSQADDFFVRNALVPVAAADVANYFVKTTTISSAQMSATSLDDYDAVFLLGLDQVDAAATSKLTAYVAQGGGLVVFPGANTDTESYNQTLGAKEFLPARLGPYKGDTNAKNSAKFFTVQTKDYDHPITTLWNDTSAGTLATTHFYAYYPLTLTPWTTSAPGNAAQVSGQPRDILRFADSSDPVAVEHTWGLGRVILFASTATIAWNDLPVHQAFVPLMQRVLGSLVARQDEGLNIRVGQKFSYAMSSDFLHKDVSVSVPGQKDAARVVGQVTLVNGLPVIEFDDTDESGSYRASIATDPPTTVYFAAQSDPNESNLTPFSAEQLKSLGKVAEMMQGNTDSSLTTRITSARTGRELWFPLLIGALVIATVETFLAQTFSKSR